MERENIIKVKVFDYYGNLVFLGGSFE